MLTENAIFSLWDNGRMLADTRGENGIYKLTPEAIDYEMQYYHSDTQLRLLSLTQDGLEHFISVYGASQTSRTLEEIRLWGTMDNKYTLESLSCFQGMTSLKRIDLNQIKLKNRNFDVLSTLPQLRRIPL